MPLTGAQLEALGVRYIVLLDAETADRQCRKVEKAGQVYLDDLVFCMAPPKH